jgi:hypothetical protein
VLRNSAAIVDHLIEEGGPHPGSIVVRPGDPADGGVPIYWSRPSDPLITLRCRDSALSARCPLDGMRVRIPAGAQPAGGYDPPPWDHDAHMAIVEPKSGWEYDLYNAQSRTEARIRFSTGGRTRIDGKGLGPAANAARYGLLGGLIRMQELQAGVINHALAMVVPCTDGHPVYPARGDGRVCAQRRNQPAMGAHFRLQMTEGQIEALQVPEWQRTILEALAKYGAYVSDTAGRESPSWAFEIESPSTYESFPGYGGKRNPWARFASRSGIAPEPAPAGDQYRFYWTRNGTLNGPPSISWQRRLRVLGACAARGTC